MEIKYCSTRNKEIQASASAAILQGLAPDGGLYVPMQFPKLTNSLAELGAMSYQEVAFAIMAAFFSDFEEVELKECIEKAYDEKFRDSLITPVKKVGAQYVLELFHGETLAFKDLALSILPHLMKTAARKQQNENEIVILTATSGDTGKAAMAGFADVKGTKIIVFYPESGVSPIQKKQMLTQKGDNTFVVGIKGNFDDAQTNVKALFNNQTLRSQMAAKGMQFSSANSMNIGRLIPQVAYYFYAYGQLVEKQAIQLGESINVTVPTGNFGNILAAYYAKELGLPINRLICASNQNNVLTDFFQQGIYDKNRPFYVTSSPSMDILVSSNLERFIYYLTDENPVETKKLMEQLNHTGRYEITSSMREKSSSFWAGFATEEETSKTIDQLYKQNQYVMDPHTAVAQSVCQAYQQETKDQTPTLIVSTASPYKFPQTVLQALNDSNTIEDSAKQDEFAWIQALHQKTGLAIPEVIKELADLPILHQTVIPNDEMQKMVETLLGI